MLWLSILVSTVLKTKMGRPNLLVIVTLKGYHRFFVVAYTALGVYVCNVQVARAITPVPGGVGPMTVAMLLHNTLKAWKKRLSIK